MVDINVKQVIFLIVFIAIVAVPVILSMPARKKKGDNEKDEDKALIPALARITGFDVLINLTSQWMPVGFVMATWAPRNLAMLFQKRHI